VTQRETDDIGMGSAHAYARPTSPFCSTCGGPKMNGVCRACATTVAPTRPPVSVPPQAERPEPAIPSIRRDSPNPAGHHPSVYPNRNETPRGNRSVLWFVPVALVIGALLATSLSMAVQSRHTEKTIMSELTTARKDTAALRQQLDILVTSADALSTQVGTLESKVNNQPNAAAVTKNAAPSVFTVVSEAGTGSGFIVSADDDSSRLITNYHVIADTYEAGEQTVKIVRGKTTYSGRIQETEQAYDLAVILIDHKLPVLPVAKKRSAVGDPLLVLGSPLGLSGTVTSGIVSAYRTRNGNREMQFSAPISPGNSGGPVINLKGQVVGVAVAKYTGDGAEGLSFAIPAQTLCSVLDVC
jgi:putative serine protease PepD